MVSPRKPAAAPRCPICKKASGIVVSERFGIQTLFCPDCDHSWDREVPERQ
jgi:hypothetical protein